MPEDVSHSFTAATACGAGANMLCTSSADQCFPYFGDEGSELGEYEPNIRSVDLESSQSHSLNQNQHRIAHSHLPEELLSTVKIRLGQPDSHG